MMREAIGTVPAAAILEIALDIGAPDPLARCTLRRDGAVAAETLASWDCRTEDLRLPAHLGRHDTIGRGHAFACPDYLVEGLAGALGEADPDGSHLWLKFVRPAGYLPLVPWEQLLSAPLRRSVLRLPEWPLAAPTDPPHRLEVALCSSEPEAKARFMIEHVLLELVGHLRMALARRVRLHLYVDRESMTRLERSLPEHALAEGSIRLHDPSGAAHYATPERDVKVSNTDAIGNPWLLWMRDSLHGTRFDVVHFVAHGYLASGQGALALAESPLENADRRIARFVGARELVAFLDQCGAYSLVLDSPANNYSEMGLRMLADTVAQRRPGPVLHHERRLDPDGEHLAVAYHLLHGGGAVPRTAPALSVYCDPSWVERTRTSVSSPREATRSPAPRPERVASPSPREILGEGGRNARVTSTLGDETPAWIAASERFFEQQTLALAREVDEGGTTGVTAAARHDMLQKLRTLVERGGKR